MTELDLTPAVATGKTVPLAPAPAPAAVAGRQPRAGVNRVTGRSRAASLPAPAPGPAKGPDARAPLPGRAPTASIGGGTVRSPVPEKGPKGTRRLQVQRLSPSRVVEMSGIHNGGKGGVCSGIYNGGKGEEG
jgi:hypothetical protein